MVLDKFQEFLFWKVLTLSKKNTFIAVKWTYKNNEEFNYKDNYKDNKEFT